MEKDLHDKQFLDLLQGDVGELAELLHVQVPQPGLGPTGQGEKAGQVQALEWRKHQQM